MLRKPTKGYKLPKIAGQPATRGRQTFAKPPGIKPGRSTFRSGGIVSPTKSTSTPGKSVSIKPSYKPMRKISTPIAPRKALASKPTKATDSLIAKVRLKKR